MTEYRAHYKQSAFHNAVRNYDVVLFNGGRGSGKTTAGAIQALLEALEYQPGSAGIIVAPTYPMLQDATMKEFFKWLPLNEKRAFYKQRHVLVLRNGSEIAFRSADNPDSLRGPNRAWAWFDEPRNLRNRDAFDIVAAQLRPTRKMWLTTTPAGIFHWLYQIFVANPLDDSHVVTVRTTENPYLPETYADSLRRQYTGKFASQELDADWVSFEGLVYDNFSIEHNVTEAAEYKPDWGRVVWGVDDGYAYGDGPGSAGYHPRVIIFGQKTPDGGYHIFDEYVEAGVADYATTIGDALSRPYTRPVIAMVDSSAAMFLGALYEHSVYSDGATHKVDEGIKAVRQMVCDGNEVRQLLVHPRCTHTIREFQSYRYDSPNRPAKVDDHCMDAVRYAVWGVTRYAI